MADRAQVADAPSGMPMTVSSVLRRCYRDYAELPALVDGETRYSFAELGAAVACWRRGMDIIGVPEEARIVLIANNSAEFAIAEQAVFCSGRVRVAISPRLGAHEIADIVSDCRPALILGDRVTMPTVTAALQLASDALEPVLVSVDGNETHGGYPVRGFAELEALGQTESAQTVATGATPAPGDLAALLYTSGTTGRSKGAMITHGAWLAMIRNSLVELPPVVPGERFLTVAPMTHLGGYLALCFTARGCCQVIHRTFDPGAVLEAVERDGVNHIPLVPTMISMLTAAASDLGRPVRASGLRSVSYAASPIDSGVLRRAIDLFGPVFVQFYGLSEIPMPLTCLSTSDHAVAARDAVRSSRLASAGRICPFVDLRIVDRDGFEVGSGTIGEVWAACDTTMVGYWRRPDATAATLQRGWLRTGDLGLLDASGFLHLVGRAKDLIITGGFNVYPSEIEAILAEDQRVDDVAVLGIPDTTWGELVHAAIVPSRDALTDADLASLREQVRQQLANYKAPRSFSQHTELPRNGVGKVLRRVLRHQISGSASQNDSNPSTR